MKVIDGYLPDWLIDKVASEIPIVPVTYTNSPYGDYETSRFFGCNLVEREVWVAPCPPFFFIDYLHQCVCNDILLDYIIDHLDRCLLNCQTQGLNAQPHTDSNSNTRISGIYQVVGDGDTVFYNTELKETYRVPFKQGRLILFNSTIWHQGLPPTTSPVRYSLGYIWHLNYTLDEHDPQGLSNVP